MNNNLIGLQKYEDATGKNLNVSVVSGGSSSTNINQGKINVATSGLAIQLPDLTASRVLIKALTSNINKIYVGNSSVNTTNGMPLEAGESLEILISNSNLIYIDADTDGEGINYLVVG